MVTTIIAIYGAVVATVSTVLGAWYFLYSGPRLQAEADVDPGEIDREWDDIRYILLQVWNAGRAEVTVDITALMINPGNNYYIGYPFDHKRCISGEGRPDYVAPELDGPELPIRIPGHSGERWVIRGIDPRRAINEPWTTATLSVILLVGGRRTVDLPVLDNSYRRVKHPFILKPVSSQPELTANALIGLGRRCYLS
jgi:hypothetical protein